MERSPARVVVPRARGPARRRRELDEGAELAEALRQPAQLQMTLGTRRAVRAPGGAARGGGGADRRVGDARGADLDGLLLNARMELWMLRRHQGRLPETREAIEPALEFPERAVLPMCPCALECRARRDGRGPAAVPRLAADRFAEFPDERPDGEPRPPLRCGHAAERRRASRVLYELLLPAACLQRGRRARDLHRGRGSEPRRLAAPMGSWDDAESHLRSASK